MQWSVLYLPNIQALLYWKGKVCTKLNAVTMSHIQQSQCAWYNAHRCVSQAELFSYVEQTKASQMTVPNYLVHTNQIISWSKFKMMVEKWASIWEEYHVAKTKSWKVYFRSQIMDTETFLVYQYCPVLIYLHGLEQASSLSFISWQHWNRNMVQSCQYCPIHMFQYLGPEVYFINKIYDLMVARHTHCRQESHNLEKEGQI